MARARNIKPGFFKNEDLAECSVWARLLFPGLWMMADREGRLEDRPKRLKGEIFPYDSVEIEPLLDELEKHNFLIRYSNEEGNFIQILKFKDHQNPHYSEKPSVIKPPNSENCETLKDGDFQEPSESDPSLKRGQNVLIPESLLLNPDSLNPESGIPRKADARATRLPTDWILPTQWCEWAEEEKGWSSEKVWEISHGFKDYWIAKAGKDGKKLDWFATWRNWCRNQRDGGSVQQFGKTSQGIALLEKMKG